MVTVTYKDMTVKYGKRPAFQLLRTLEKLTHIKDEIASMDLEARFDKAIKAIVETDFA